MTAPRIRFGFVLGWILATGSGMAARSAETETNWAFVALGDNAGPVEAVATGETVSLSGHGGGVGAVRDEATFGWRTWAEGDVEFVARLVDLQGNPGTVAGLMLRADNQPDAPVIAVGCESGTPGETPNRIFWRSRSPEPHAGPGLWRGFGRVSVLNHPPELYLKLVRLGDYFAAYKSSNGQWWTPVSNSGGSFFSPKGPLRIGFFVAGPSDGDATPAASFDRIRIGPPRLEWRTSWVGNTYGSRPDDRHVPNHINAMWIDPRHPGVMYTKSFWEEAAEGVQVFDPATGRIIKSLRDGNECFGSSFSGEGAMTGDERQMFIATRNDIYTTNPMGAPATTRRMDADNDLNKGHINIVGGMATDGNHLFFSDTREQRIRVLRVDQPRYFTAGNTEVRRTAEAIDREGVANAAPEKVYQSFRFTDATAYRLPVPGPGKYTVRGHFAQYDEETRPGAKVSAFRFHGDGGDRVEALDVRERAGGFNKALVVDLAGVTARPDENDGHLLVVGLHRGANPEHVLICGFEVFDETGERVFALNCAGPAVAGFAGESWEDPDRAFDFERPGAMALDARGELWILQRPNDFPAQDHWRDAKYPPAILCYTRDGQFTGRRIDDLVNPTALAYDATRDQLVVAENGPDQQLRYYEGLADHPVLSRTFGVTGGLWAGENPGLLIDPEAGGAARFHDLNAVAVDAEGSLYVNSGLNGTDIRKFTPDGALAWRVCSTMFCNTPDFDPDSDGAEIRSTYSNMELDLDQTEPGSEWKYRAFAWNPARFGAPMRIGHSQALLRRMGPERSLILFTSAQGVLESIKIFRYEGELVVPCGEWRGTFWLDDDGDGRESEAEVRTTAPRHPGTLFGYDVDDRGDLWLAFGRNESPAAFLRHHKFLGLDKHGAPRYGVGEGEFTDIPFPNPANAGAWGNFTRVNYDAERDVMVLVAPSATRTRDAGECPRQYMARYDDWSGARTERWRRELPDPSEDPDMTYSGPGNPPHHWMGMDVAGDYIFFASLWGQVNVYDLDTGALRVILSPGPEVIGTGAWDDASMGLRAFQRKNGEYLVFVEHSGWGGKCQFFRWTPETR